MRGQYLQVDMIGTNEIFCLVSNDWNLLFIVGGAVAGAAVLAIVILILKGGTKCRENKKSKKTGSSGK